MTEPSPDWLDDLLERPRVIEDAGFTERVVTELPSPPNRLVRGGILALAAGLGTAATLVATGASPTEILVAWSQFDAWGQGLPLTSLAVLGTLAGLHFGLLAAQD